MYSSATLLTLCLQSAQMVSVGGAGETALSLYNITFDPSLSVTLSAFEATPQKSGDRITVRETLVTFVADAAVESTKLRGTVKRDHGQAKFAGESKQEQVAVRLERTMIQVKTPPVVVQAILSSHEIGVSFACRFRGTQLCHVTRLLLGREMDSAQEIMASLESAAKTLVDRTNSLDKDRKADSLSQLMGRGLPVLGAGRVARRRLVSATVGRSPRALTLDKEANLSRSAVMKVLNKNVSQIQRCYEHELLKQADLLGRVEVEWTVSAAGSVRDLRSTRSTVSSKPLVACILKKMQTWSFPKPKNGPVRVAYPYIFRSISF